MSKKHPCRKVVLNEIDRKLLTELDKRDVLSFSEVLDLTGLQKEQLLKRLKSLHRDGVLRFSSDGRISRTLKSRH